MVGCQAPSILLNFSMAAPYARFIVASTLHGPAPAVDR
jgi:hypothetical protein